MTSIAADDRWLDDSRGEHSFRAVPSLRGRYRGLDREHVAHGEAGVALAKYGAHTVADPLVQLSELVAKALDASTTDFRLRDSLARELGADADDVESAVRLLGSVVRRPVSVRTDYDDWYRLTSRGLTRREKWRRFRAIVGKTSID